MHIICRNCNTNFIVDSQQIGNEGRKVKCSQCGNIWHVSNKISDIETTNKLLEQGSKNKIDIKDTTLKPISNEKNDVKIPTIQPQAFSSDYKEQLSKGINLPVRINNTINPSKLALNLLTGFLLIANICLSYLLYNYNKYLQQDMLLDKISFQNINCFVENEEEKFIVQYELHNNFQKKLFLPIISTEIFDKNNKIINSHLDKLNVKLLNNNFINISTEFYNLKEEIGYVNITLGNKLYFIVKNFLDKII